MRAQGCENVRFHSCFQVKFIKIKHPLTKKGVPLRDFLDVIKE